MIILGAIVGLLAIGILNVVYRYQNHRRPRQHKKLMPWIELTEGGHVKKIEQFGEYVVRQLGLTPPDHCSRVAELAEEYLRGDKSNSDKSQDGIYLYLSMFPEEDIEFLFNQMIDELDRCILSYFAFHWEHSTFMVNQILRGNSPRRAKLRDAVIFATRKQRFERVMKKLKPKQLFSTLINQIRAIGHDSNLSMDIVVPADANVRSPVLLLTGGGMGVGKSTVVKDILKTSFWSSAAKNAVVVEADAFKETDVIYQELNSKRHDDMLETAELVHQASINAAESLLVTALNEGRDVIFDGSMSWEPFVLQTINMARDVHRRQYRMGPGYQIGDDGSVQEKYWEPVEDINPLDGTKMIENVIENDGDISCNEASGMEAVGKSLTNVRKPYRIELVGVICDAHLAVVRGLRRAIMTKRAVRVKEQLKSIKRFATALPHYCREVDDVKLYSTNDIGHPAKKIGWKEGSSELLVNPEAIKALSKLASLNEDARSVYELYNSWNDGSELDKVWKDNVLSPERDLCQQQLRTKIQFVEHESYLPKRKVRRVTSSSSSSSFISSSDNSRQSSLDSSSSDSGWQVSSYSQENSKDSVEPDFFSNLNYPKAAETGTHLNSLDGFSLRGFSLSR